MYRHSTADFVVIAIVIVALVSVELDCSESRCYCFFLGGGGFGFVSYLGDFIVSKLFNEKHWFVVPVM